MLNKLLPILGLALLSCNAEKQLQKAETKLSQSGRLAQICADRYPSRDSIVVKDSIIVDTFLLGEYIFDTIRVNDTIVITKHIPIIKTKIRTQIVYRQDNAKVDALQKELDKCRQDLAVANGKHAEALKEIEGWKKSAKYRLWWLWIVVVLSVGWTFRKFITKIA